MNLVTSAVLLSLALFMGMMASLELGFRTGRRHSSRMDDAHEGIGVIEAALFALLGLLLGFSFGGTMSRLDARRQLIVRETNAIGSAYLWLDVMPAADQPDMRGLFREYLEARLRVYGHAANLATVDRFIGEAAALQQRIWARAVTSSHADPTQNTSRLLLPAISEMIDVTTARTVALRTHLPSLILGLLIAFALLGAFVAGYAMSKRQGRGLVHSVLFAAAVTVTIYAVLDLDDPRFGLIRLDAAEKVLHQLHDSIRP
ncbi:MAG TPA: DUF4239 domain-containing protein [Candidatus Eisenbacteria bacterium]|jgi:uncharacterized membrane protein